MTGGVIDGPATEAITKAIFDDLTSTLEVPVLWGPPTGGSTPTEFISVGFGMNGESWESDRDWVGNGRVTVDEDFKLVLCVESTVASGPDLRPAFDRSIAIAKEVEAALREDPGVEAADTHAQIRNLKFSRMAGRYFRLDKTRGHRVFLTITGIARI